jgi:hypothetical protein
MRFALKVFPLAALGTAAALLVACGDGNGLLSGNDAGSLQGVLANVQSACAGGRSDDAALAAQQFSDRVAALSPQAVDRRLIANLQQGAGTLERLVSRTCTQTTTTTTTPTTTTSTSTATTETATTPTTTTPTTETTAPPPSTEETPPPDAGGGTPPGQGGTPPGHGGTPPGQSGGASPEGGG